MVASASMFVQRHVLPANVAPPVDDDGFLLLDERRPSLLAAAPMPIELEALVGDSISYTLLASDGVGKTRALNHLHNLEPGSVWLDLSHFGIDGLRSELDRLAIPGARVFLDSVDLALLYEPRVSEVLAARIEDSALNGVLWRIGCRPASWNSRLSEAFGVHVKEQSGGQELHFPLKRQYTLLPLTRSAVEALAGQTVAEPQLFVSALAEAHLGRLSGHPGRITSVARRWGNSGELPAGQSEALDFEIRELLSEYNIAHQTNSLNSYRKHVIAERLGAFTMFCSAERYRPDDRPEPNTTAIVDLPIVAEPTEPGVEYPPSHYHEVLATALFDPAQDGAIGFRHQQYAEYLAASYLISRGVSADKIRMLLSVAEDGTLPSAMVGVAAWVAVLDPDLIRSTVLSNSAAFLKSRVDLPSDQLRHDLVDRILADAAAGDIDLLFGYRFTNLAYPGLETQLLARIEGEPVGALELWWIARLAGDGGCTALSASLARLAETPGLPAWARRACVKTIGLLGTVDERQSLVPLLELPASEDPSDEVFASVIEATFPELLSIDDLLGALRPRRDKDFVGAYLVLLGNLPSRIPAPDLPKVLDWASNHAAENRWGFGRLVPQLIRVAWTSPAAADLIPYMGKLIATAANAGHWGDGALDVVPPWVGDPQSGLRRSLLIEALRHIDDHHSYRLDDLHLFSDVDALWAIDVIPQLDSLAQEILATWVARIPEPSVELIDAVLVLAEDHPAYEPTLFWRGSQRIDSLPAVRHRSRLADKLRVSTEAARIRAGQEDTLRRVIAETEDDVRQWWRITVALLADTRSEDWLNFDLTERRGWNWLDHDQQKHVLELGRQYLHLHQLEPSNWLAKKNIPVHLGLADWSGAQLLATLACHWPVQLTELEPDVWRRWAPAIIGAWDTDPSVNFGARHMLMTCVPDAAGGALAAALWEHLDALQLADKSLSRNPSIEWAVQVEASDLSERLVSGRYSGRLAEDLLDLLAEQDEAQTVRMCWKLLDERDSQLRPRAARVLAELVPTKLVANILTGYWARQDLHVFVSRIDFMKLDPDSLEALACFLLDTFPLAEDPPFKGGWVGEWSIHDTLQIRAGSLKRLADEGHIQALERIATNRGDLELKYLKLLVRQARTSAADLAVRPIEPQELLTLLELADARVIRTTGDLLVTTLHQLKAIQHDLKTTGLFRDVWNDSSTPPTPKSEDSISDWLQRELKHRLGRPIFIDREIQVLRTAERGVGTRIDLTFSTTSSTRTPIELRVIAEAKLVKNPEVDSALRLQLYERYMEPLRLRHGLYLVFWLQPDQRPNSWSKAKHPDLNNLLADLQTQAKELTNVKIIPFVLDISRPD